jgi:hypothetical protein
MNRKWNSIVILASLVMLSLPAMADPLLFWSSRHGYNVVTPPPTTPTARPGGGNDVLPQIIKRPVNGGCTNGCTAPTKLTRLT